MEALLEANADPNSSSDGTPLILLAVRSKPYDDEIVKALVHAKSDPNCSCEEGMTPLMEAARGGHLGVVRMLLHCHEVLC